MDNAPESVPHLSWLINQGLAVALLLLFLWASWRAIAWIGTAFLIPLRDGALKHLNDVGQSLGSLAACLRELGVKTEEINERTKRLEADLESNRAQCIAQASQSYFRGTKGSVENAKPHSQGT